MTSSEMPPVRRPSGEVEHAFAVVPPRPPGLVGSTLLELWSLTTHLGGSLGDRAGAGIGAVQRLWPGVPASVLGAHDE